MKVSQTQQASGTVGRKEHNAQLAVTTALGGYPETGIFISSDQNTPIRPTRKRKRRPITYDDDTSDAESQASLQRRGKKKEHVAAGGMSLPVLDFESYHPSRVAIGSDILSILDSESPTPSPVPVLQYTSQNRRTGRPKGVNQRADPCHNTIKLCLPVPEVLGAAQASCGSSLKKAGSSPGFIGDIFPSNMSKEHGTLTNPKKFSEIRLDDSCNKEQRLLVQALIDELWNTSDDEVDATEQTRARPANHNLPAATIVDSAQTVAPLETNSAVTSSVLTRHSEAEPVAKVDVQNSATTCNTANMTPEHGQEIDPIPLLVREIQREPLQASNVNVQRGANKANPVVILSGM